MFATRGMKKYIYDATKVEEINLSALYLGKTERTLEEITDLLDEKRDNFDNTRYSLLSKKNCRCFVHVMCIFLGVEQRYNEIV